VQVPPVIVGVAVGRGLSARQDFRICVRVPDGLVVVVGVPVIGRAIAAHILNEQIAPDAVEDPRSSIEFIYVLVMSYRQLVILSHRPRLVVPLQVVVKLGRKVGIAGINVHGDNISALRRIIFPWIFSVLAVPVIGTPGPDQVLEAAGVGHVVEDDAPQLLVVRWVAIRPPEIEKIMISLIK
jgi:hypothetical protein